MAISATQPSSSLVETTSHTPSHSQLRTAPSLRTIPSHCAPTGLVAKIKSVATIVERVEIDLESVVGLEIGITPVLVGHDLGRVTVTESCADEKSVPREGDINFGWLGRRFTGQGFRLDEVRDARGILPNGVIESAVDTRHLFDKGDIEDSRRC